MSYAYTGAGRLSSSTQTDLTTTFRYDGLGRNLTTTTDTDYGDETTTAVWAGMEVIQQTSDVSGTATLVQDALGQVALQSRTPGDTSNAATWSLQDRLGSTVAQTTTNGRITDLATYSDFGIPTFTSTGYASPTGYTGELTDATTGANSYFSRTYDPFTATWLTTDTYRGTLTNPQSQHRYGYVEGNPTTFVAHEIVGDLSNQQTVFTADEVLIQLSASRGMWTVEVGLRGLERLYGTQEWRAWAEGAGLPWETR